MDIEYIVVQAGGKGTRLHHLTKNKPKAIVPVNNLPMIFHLFHKFPDKKFIIIADYKADVLERYLQVFSPVKYIIVNATGNTGTCAGIGKAISYIPVHKAFMLIWSDLVLGEKFELPEKEGNYIGLSGTFPCRWKYENGVFEEESSVQYGVSGSFIFKDKSYLTNVPESGEFVRWLKEKNEIYEVFTLGNTKEFGLLEEYNKLKQEKCRPFNRIEEKDGRIIKTGIDEQGRALAVREKTWYQYVYDKGIKAIPRIFSFEPFEMEKIDGRNIYEYGNLSFEDKKEILRRMIAALDNLHNLGSKDADYFSIWDAYISKTYKRLDKIRDLVPFADRKIIRINGKDCRNIFYYKKEVAQKLLQYQPEKFYFIHGDCTFSNMMLRNGREPVFIDPRGYFGHEELYGDIAYDWAKLYYSLKGNYDQFNLKKFMLDIEENEIKLSIESNHWEELEDVFMEAVSKDVSIEYIKLFHAIIWLSLTTYAWEDYDSICGAFYNGLYYLEEVL